ncbi:hypothetical protein CCYA_CCYA01G0311 [Cyanidiococcus yangmingshanensis]|nr:hypothetical protein CCYA_CCYA01G0311 [Cyanidiococcus yangmingshanensis]
MHRTRPGGTRRWKSVANEGVLVCALLGCVLFLLYLVLALLNQRQTGVNVASAQDLFILRPRRSSFRLLESPERFVTLSLVGSSLGRPAVLRTVERALALAARQFDPDYLHQKRFPFVITMFMTVGSPSIQEVRASGNQRYVESTVDSISRYEGLRYWYRSQVLRPEFGGRSVIHPRRWLEELRRNPEEIELTVSGDAMTPRLRTHEPPTYTFRFLQSLAKGAPASFNGTWSWNAAEHCLSNDRICGRDSHALHSEYTWWRSEQTLSSRRLSQWLNEALILFRKAWNYDPSVFSPPFDEWTVGFVNAVTGLARSRSSTWIPGFQTSPGQASKLRELCQGRIPLQPSSNGKKSNLYCQGYYEIYEGPRIQVPDLDADLDAAVLEEHLVKQITASVEQYYNRTFLTVSEYLQMRRQGVSRELWPPYGTAYRNFRDEAVEIELNDAPCLQRHGWWRRQKRLTLGPGQSFFHSCVPEFPPEESADDASSSRSRQIALESGAIFSESL